MDSKHECVSPDCNCDGWDGTAEHNIRLSREAHARRKTDTRPVPPASPVTMREALARALDGNTVPTETTLTLAADKLRRDEQNNAEMIDVLVRAGYNDIPAQIDASVIRRLIGYITPR